VSLDSQLDRSKLERKDRDELATIVTTLGGKPGRSKKSDLVDMILELTAGAGQEGDGDGTGEDGDSTALVRDDGYSLEHVRTAAIEAGIGAEYLDAALADLQVERTLSGRKGGGRLARRFLGDPPDAIVVSRLVEAPPERVLRAMEELVPREPYRLILRERQGDPLDGGLLLFDIEGAGFTAREGFTGLASYADLREVLVTLRPAPDREGPATTLTVRGPVAWAHRLNAGIGGVMVGVSSGVGFAIGTPLGFWAAAALVTAGLGGGVAAAAAGLIAATGFGMGGAAGTEGFRALYRYSLGKGRRGLEGLVSEIALRAQGGGKGVAALCIGGGMGIAMCVDVPKP